MARIILPNDRIAIFGQTGMGKSILSHYLFWTVSDYVTTDIGQFPFWRLIIDVTNTINDPALVFTDPTKIPWEDSSSLRFVPDANNLETDIEACYQSILAHGYCFIWLDEANEVSSAHRTIPGLRKVLLQGRKMLIGHIAVSPRPADIIPTIISQSQHIITFFQALPDDWDRLAAVMGIRPHEMETVMEGMGDFEYLWYSARDREVVVMPPLPEEIVDIMTAEEAVS